MTPRLQVSCQPRGRSGTPRRRAWRGPPAGGRNRRRRRATLADAAYGEAAERILSAARADDGAWRKLAYLTDRIRHRLSGSRVLELAVIWTQEALHAEAHENVRGEEVRVPVWVRGEAQAEVVAPVRHTIALLALGGWAATPRAA
jgi:carboxypeptidase Q